MLLLLPGAAVAPAHAGQIARLIADQPRDLAVRVQFEIGQRLEPVDEIARHAGRKAADPAPARAPWPPAREIHRRLARRIAAAHQHHFAPGHSFASMGEAQ